MTESRRFDHALFPRSSSDFFFLSLDCMHEQYFLLSPPPPLLPSGVRNSPALPWICAITKNDKNTSCIQGNYVQGHLAPSVGYICPRFSLFIFCPSFPPFNRIAPGKRSHRYLRVGVGTLAADGDAWTKLAPSHRSPFVSSTPSVPTKEGENRAEMGVRRGREGRSRKGPKLPPTHMVQQLLLCKGAKRMVFTLL